MFYLNNVVVTGRKKRVITVNLLVWIYLFSLCFAKNNTVFIHYSHLGISQIFP